MKKLFLILTLSLSLFGAQSLQDKIKSFVGPSKYESQRNLIQVLFAQKANFLQSNGEVDSVKVISVLKKNGLMQLLYEKPVQLRLAFRTKEAPLIFLKIVNETLEALGYNYFLTNNALRDSAGFVWEIYLQTEHIVDPESLAKALGAKGCTITDIVKNDDHYWFYDIDSSKATLSARKLEAGEKSFLGKPLKPYWIDVQGLQEVTVLVASGDKWFPDVVFFDKNLHLLSDVKSEESAKSLKLTVPANAMYLKLSDAVMLENIKHGLTVQAK